MKLVSAAEMHILENRAVECGISLPDLMQNAGQAVADEISGIFDPIAGKKIVVLVGSGNNGGDGLVTSRHLKAADALVDVYLVSPRGPNDTILAETVTSGVSPIESSADVGFKRLIEL